MFIKTDIKRCREHGTVFWWSGAIVSIDGCPGRQYLFDLVTYSYTEDPMSLLLTARKIDSSIKIESTTDISAPYVSPRKSGPNMIEEALYTLSRDRDRYIEKEIERIAGEGEEVSREPPRGISRIFRRYQIVYMRRREVQKEILRGLVSEMLRSLCIEDVSRRPRLSMYTPMYFIVAVDFSRREFYECLGKRVIRSRSHERYVFGNRELLENLDHIIRLWRQ